MGGQVSNELLVTSRPQIERRRRSLQLAGQLCSFLFDKTHKTNPEELKSMLHFAAGITLNMFDDEGAAPGEQTSLGSFESGSEDDHNAQRLLAILGIVYDNMSPADAGMEDFEGRFEAFGLDAYPVSVHGTEGLVLRVEGQEFGADVARYDLTVIRRSQS